jgi:U3 small nucleolar RNA-associated protein 14
MNLGRHSKPSNKKRVLTPKLRSQANIAGYEKRLARKAKSSPTTNLYEHLPEKTHRSKIALDLGRDDEFEFPNAWDGADDEDREGLRAWLIGESHEDGEKVASDDDDEVNSDAAFEESDEERFGLLFSHKVCL